MFLTKSKQFLACCFAAVLGLSFGLHLSQTIFLGLLIFVAVLGSIFWQKKLLVVLVIIFAVCGYRSIANKPMDLSKYYEQKKTTIRVVVKTDPEIKEKSINFNAEVVEIESQSVNSGIKVTLPRYPIYQYGDLLELEGELQPKSEYSAKENISGEIVFPQVTIIKSDQANLIIAQLYKLKNTLLNAISDILPEPQSGLLGGLLLGTKRMSQELQEDFRRAGTSHIVAVSGFNVTIVASILDKLFRRFGRTASFYASLLAITGFVIITGASASVVRAGFMGSLVLLAQHFGRIYAGVNAIMFAAAIMMFQNPRLLQFDIGFQLSFAALAGLMFVQPKFEERASNSFLKNFVLPTISAQITTTPIILYHFGNFSVISVLSNFLVLPFIAITMLVGFIAMISHLIIPALDTIVSSVVWLLLTYIIKVIELCSKIPAASISEIPFPLWALGLYYAILIWCLWKLKPKILSSI